MLHSECDTPEKLALVVDLIDRFTYLTGDQVEIDASEIVAVIDTHWNLDPSNTAISTKNIDDENDSSVAVNYIMQKPFAQSPKEWTKDNFFLRILDAIEDKTIENIVLIDDFSGSGFSLEKITKWIAKRAQERAVEKNVYACFFCVMEATRDRKYPDVLKRLYSVRTLTRGITDHYQDDVIIKKATMVELENSLVDFPSTYSLGYQKSEALYATQNFNMPNNNFPIFWHKSNQDGVIRKPLFSRLSRRPRKTRAHQ